MREYLARVPVLTCCINLHLVDRWRCSGCGRMVGTVWVRSGRWNKTEVLLPLQHFLHEITTVLLRWCGRRVMLLCVDTLRTNDANGVCVGVISRCRVCRHLYNALLVAGRAAEDAVAPTAVAFNVYIVGCRDIVSVLIGRRIHPCDEGYVTPRTGFRCGWC